MSASTEEPATTGRCQACLDQDRYSAEIDTLIAAGRTELHPLVMQAVRRHKAAGLLADHPMTLDPRCPHEIDLPR